MIVNESKSMFYSNYKAINVSKCENRYLKALSPLTEQIDAIKDVSLIKDVFVCKKGINKSIKFREAS